MSGDRVRKTGFLLLAGVVGSAPAAAHDQSSPPPALTALGKPDTAPSCQSDDPKTVVVCGRSQQRYRIDPTVLEATRQAEALPPKTDLDATTVGSCIGPNCGGGTIPLVGMALTAVKAAVLASEGQDWREAFRTHPDQYQVYQKAKQSHISVGISAGNSRPQTP